jgi:hypothetical protein
MGTIPVSGNLNYLSRRFMSVITLKHRQGYSGKRKSSTYIVFDYSPPFHRHHGLASEKPVMFHGIIAWQRRYLSLLSSNRDSVLFQGGLGIESTKGMVSGSARPFASYK